MEILKHIVTSNLEILIKRVEKQKIEIISKTSIETIPTPAVIRDTESYETKNVPVQTAVGDVYFGISIKRSIR